MAIFDKMVLHRMVMKRIDPTFVGLSEGRADWVGVQKIDHGMPFGSEDLEPRIKSADQRPAIFRLADHAILKTHQQDRCILHLLVVDKSACFGRDADWLGFSRHPLEK
jgi:hypothetical protein